LLNLKTNITNLLPVDGICSLQDAFYAQERANELYRILMLEVDWKQYSIKIFGKIIPQPRLTAWYGEKEAAYSYSGIQLEPIPFTPLIEQIKADIEALSGYKFNSVLLNLYRNQNDSMGWHSDDEKELGPDPKIASVSLGSCRMFQLKHKTQKQMKLKVHLNNGSLLLMEGTMQHHWLHAIPKSTQESRPRINLTFRKIL
jgi:alkylated DNA repair dioxygenase AlkB